MATQDNRKTAMASSAPRLSTLELSRQPAVTAAFAQALTVLAPGATGRDLQALFGGKVTREAILNWRDGRRLPPRWARDLVRTKLAELAELERVLDQEPPAPANPGLIVLRRHSAYRRAQKQNAPD